jgi:hypothetical protein
LGLDGLLPGVSTFPFMTDLGSGRLLGYYVTTQVTDTVGNTVVRMKAATVNRVDLYMRDSGAGITRTLPQIICGRDRGSRFRRAWSGRLATFTRLPRTSTGCAKGKFGFRCKGLS